MYSFALERLEIVKGKQTFYHLKINGNSEFKNFCDSISNNPQFHSELRTLFARMDQIANLIGLPHGKFKDITPVKEIVKEYEFKTRNLRAYAFKTSDGKIIVCAGFKTGQKRDIMHFRKIKNTYLNSLIEKK